MQHETSLLTKAHYILTVYCNARGLTSQARHSHCKSLGELFTIAQILHGKIEMREKQNEREAHKEINQQRRRRQRRWWRR